MSSNAVGNVFGTYELLESVILALPGEVILIAAHVCQTWRNLITSSIAIGKRIQATPFFLLEQQRLHNDHSQLQSNPSTYFNINAVTHLMLDCCDVVMRRVGVPESLLFLESIALLRKTPLGPTEKIFVKFLKTDEVVPGLTVSDPNILRLGWTSALAKRFNSGHHQELLSRLEHGLSLSLCPGAVQKKAILLRDQNSDTTRPQERVAIWENEDRFGREDSIRANGYIDDLEKKKKKGSSPDINTWIRGIN